MKPFSQVALSILLVAVACFAAASPPQVIVKVSGTLRTAIEQVGGAHPSSTYPFTYDGLTGPVTEVLELSAAPKPTAGHVINWQYSSKEYRDYPNELEFSYKPSIFGSGVFIRQSGSYKRIQAATHTVITVYVLAPKGRTVHLDGIARGFQKVNSSNCFRPMAATTTTGHDPWEVFDNGSSWEEFLFFNGNYQSSGTLSMIGGFGYYAVQSYYFDSSCDGLDYPNQGTSGTFTGEAGWSIRIHAKVLN